MSKNIILIFISIFLIQCTKDENPIFPNTNDDFAIFLLQNSNLRINDILTQELTRQDSQELASIDIQSSPWLTDKDIQFYDFSSHILYLKEDRSLFFPDLENDLFPKSWWDKPFIVVADGEKRYVGTFKGSLSSMDWPVPYISDFYNSNYPEDIICISWVWFYSDLVDTRHDSLVKQALIEANIYHAGINIEIDDILIKENSDTSTIEYKFTITNNDKDNIYTIDPDKMDIDLFHYFHNGPVFMNLDDGNLYESKLKKVKIPEPHDYWDPNWFIKINSDDSIKRSVTLKGYPYFPEGSYYCEFSYMGPKKIQKNQRILSDGRYWIGSAKSNVVSVIIH